MVTLKSIESRRTHSRPVPAELVRCFASLRDSIYPLRSPELRALRQIQRDYADTSYVFVSERKAPLSTRSIRHIIARAGELAGLPFQVHPHQLRHARGYYLAAQGHDTRAIQDYLGHKNIHHTVRYTQMSPPWGKTSEAVTRGNLA